MLRVNRLTLLAFVALLVGISSLTEAQPSRIIQIPAGSDPFAAGNALIAALANITDASAAKPYLIKLEPGTFDVGDARLHMKEWVDLEGSGQTGTTLQGAGNVSGDIFDGLVWGANNVELRNLRVHCYGGSNRPGIAIYNPQSSPAIRSVTVTAAGGNGNWGIRNAGGASPLIEDTTITVTGGTFAYGIVATGLTPSRPLVRRTVITVSGSSFAHGIWSSELSSPAELRDVQITASGTSSSYGLYYDGAGVGPDGPSFEMNYTTITANSGAARYGIYANSTGLTLRIRASRIRGTGTFNESYGIWFRGLELTVGESRVNGTTRSIDAFAQAANVGASQLVGSTTGMVCGGVYTGNMTFYPGPACP